MTTLHQNPVLERVASLAERAAEGTGVEIVEVQLRGAGKARLLRVYIDKKGGVTHGDCEIISERFGSLLDEEDAIPGESYTLEVSSPGIERKLSRPRDFERVIGQKVRLVLRNPVDGAKSVEGKLVTVTGDTLAIETGTGERVSVPLGELSKANVKFDW